MSRQLPLALKLQHAPSLDDFVVGANQLVLDALAKSLDDAGEAQIFIYGPPGCGRTHLLGAQCALGERLGLQCAYLPLGQFRELAPSVLEGLAAFDLLAIDDIQQIAGEPEWERALFVLFNECRERGSRMLFSADRAPATLPTQLPDLRSRLTWGLSLALQPLNDDDRLRLLQSLARRQALDLPEDVARYVLERTPRHPKDLVETVTRLDRASLAEKRRLTIPFVREHL